MRDHRPPCAKLLSPARPHPRKRISRWFLNALPALLLAASLLPASAGAQANPPGEIEAGFPQFPPYGFINAKEQPDGLDVRVARILFAKLGTPWRPAIYPAARLIKNMQDGSNLFSILVRIPALDACCLYSKKPIMRDEIRVYSRPGIPPIKNKEALAGQSIITIRGFSYGGLIQYFNDEKNRMTNNLTTSHESAIAMLRAGRADYGIFYGAAVKLLDPVATAGLQYGVIDELNIYLVLNKTYPEAEKTMEKMELIAETINKDELFKPFSK